MGVNNGKITAPVSFQDVRTALVDSSNDLAALCTSSKINKWAKYKPVVYTAIDTTGEWDTSTSKWKTTSTWWKATDGNCGLVIATYSGIGNPNTSNTFFYLLKNGSLSWDYRHPFGGSSSPYRLTDFALYNHRAIAPVVMPDNNTTYWLENNRLQIDLDASVDPSTSSDNLAIGDISVNGTSLSQFYLGVLLWNGTNFHYATSTSKLASSGFSIVVANASSMTGSWNMLPFLSSVAYSIDGTAVSGTYLSAGFTQSIAINIAASGTLVQLFALGYWTTSSHNAITYDVHIYNSNSSQVTVSNIRVRLLRATSSQSPSAGTQLASQNLGSRTVGAGSTSNPTEVVIQGQSITNITYNSSYVYWLEASADSYAATYNQIEEQPW